jgi:HPt (histidine-containing phosphotransfer) domain-containing protein
MLPPNAMNKVPVLDRDHLLEMTGGDEIFEHELIGAYRASVTSILDRLRSALSKGDVTQVMREAHALKGASLNVGARAMAQCAGAIEDAARGDDLTQVDRAARSLDADHAALWTELDRM